MKSFAFIVASPFVLTAIHAYASPTYGGPLGARAGIDLNSIRDLIAPFGLVGKKSGNVCGNGIGNIGYCNDIDFTGYYNDIDFGCYRFPAGCGFGYR